LADFRDGSQKDLAACCLSRLDGWHGNVTSRKLVATSDWFIACSPRSPFPNKKRNRIGGGGGISTVVELRFGASSPYFVSP
jgi:hypothetical protein